MAQVIGIFSPGKQGSICLAYTIPWLVTHGAQGMVSMVLAIPQYSGFSRRIVNDPFLNVKTFIPYFEGILPKGPYLPCVSMAGGAHLAGYHRLMECYCHSYGVWCNLYETFDSNQYLDNGENRENKGTNEIGLSATPLDHMKACKCN